MARSLRELKMTDCQAAGAIVARNPIWAERYHYEETAAARDLLYAVSHGDFVVGVFEPELVGFAWIVPKGAFARSPYLRLLAVDPRVQSGGIGAALMQHAEAHFAKQSKHLFLMVSDFNDRAQAFYRAQGYAPVGSVPAFVLADVAEQIWMKRLA